MTTHTDVAATLSALVERESAYRAVGAMEGAEVVVFLWHGDLSEQYRAAVPLRMPAMDVARWMISKFDIYIEVHE